MRPTRQLYPLSNVFYLNFLIGTYTTGTRTKTVVNETGDSSRPISVYLEHDLGNVLDSTVGLKFNTNILTIDLRLGLGDTGIYGLVNNSSDTASEFGVKIDLPHLLAGVEASSIEYSAPNRPAKRRK